MTMDRPRDDESVDNPLGLDKQHLDRSLRGCIVDVHSFLNYVDMLDEGDLLLQDFSQQIVDAADSLGAESMEYLIKASRAIAINDLACAPVVARNLHVWQPGWRRAVTESDVFPCILHFARPSTTGATPR